MTYALYLILPTFFSSIGLIIVLFLQFSKYNKLLDWCNNKIYIPKVLNAPELSPSSVLIDKFGAIFDSIILIITLVLLVVCNVVVNDMKSCWITIPSAVVILIRNFIFDYRHHFSRSEDQKFTKFKNSFPTVITILKRLPWKLVPFAVTEFILVNSLEVNGWIDIFANWARIAINDNELRAIWILGLIEIALCNVSTSGF